MPRTQPIDREPATHLENEHAALVALLRRVPKGGRWSEVTERVRDAGSACAAWEAATGGDALLADPVAEEAIDEALRDVRSWERRGWRFLGLPDEDYPVNLREVHQAPPFLLASGTVLPYDVAVAVVGTRQASAKGARIAGNLSTRLAGEGITVVSGLAEGIDTAAHQATLAAGGRTVAILGTGIARAYPAANRDLQDAIAHGGLVLSQFWPEAPPQKRNFLLRNAVMSGYSQATLVVEAGERSGARAQARMAVEHGRPVILTDRVLEGTAWGTELAKRPGVRVASGVQEAVSHVHEALDREEHVGRLLDELQGSAL
jgi:DNA processing protein